MFKGLIVLVGPRFESTATGYLATLPGTFATVQVQALITILNKANAIDGERLFVKLTAQSVNLKNVVLALWPGAPDGLLKPLDITFPTFRAETSPGGALGCGSLPTL